MYKVLLMSLLLMSFSASRYAQEEPVTVDGIVARVNRDIITLSAYRRAQEELRHELAQQFQGRELETQYQQALKQLLHSLIDTQLLVQKADELGLTVEAEINEYLIELAKQNNFAPSQIDDMLRQMNMDPDQARQLLRVRFLRERVIGREVYPRVFQNILDKDIDEFYQKNLDQFTEPAGVKLSEIFIKFDGRTRREATQLVEQLVAQLIGGANFAELAKKYSDGPTASEGGNLGWFNLEPRPELGEIQRKAIERKQVGQVTDPIEFADGIRVLRIDERRERKVNPLTAELRRRISIFIAQQRIEPAVEEYLKKLREDAFLCIAAPYRTNDDRIPSCSITSEVRASASK